MSNGTPSGWVERAAQQLAPQPEPEPFDLTGRIIAYETGEATDEETTELFQHLVNTGMAWTLQGFYGRAALQLVEAGLVTAPAHAPGNPVHRNCPACKLSMAQGVPFTVLPCSETYWQS